MGKLSTFTSWFLLIVGAVAAQTAQTQDAGRLLPQWLTGLIAVAAFLFLAFVSVLVKKAWCEESSRAGAAVESVRENEFVVTADDAHNSSLDMLRSKEDRNAYENVVIDSTEEKVTTM